MLLLTTLFLVTSLLLSCKGKSTSSDSIKNELASYSNGDTLILMQEAKISSHPDRLNSIRDLEAGDSVRLVGKEEVEGEISIRVHHNGVKGWMFGDYDFSNTEYYNNIQQEGLEVVILNQYITKGEANDSNVHVGLSNVDHSKAIKSITFVWKLFDEAGNPASTDRFDSNTLVATDDGLYGTGIEPGHSTYPTFDIGYTPEGSCIELHEIKLEFSNGGTSTYSGDSLNEITRQGEDVRLAGECS